MSKFINWNDFVTYNHQIIQVILLLDFFISGLGVSLAVCEEASIVCPSPSGIERFIFDTRFELYIQILTEMVLL